MSNGFGGDADTKMLPTKLMTQYALAVVLVRFTVPNDPGSYTLLERLRNLCQKHGLVVLDSGNLVSIARVHHQEWKPLLSTYFDLVRREVTQTDFRH